MTIFPWDLPGYIQGHRFSDEARYWDAATGRFHDLAGYDHLGNYVELVEGTPAFSAQGANNRTGLKLDNSNTYKFLTAVPWEGSMLFVIKPFLTGLSATFYPLLFGAIATEQSNGQIRLAMTRQGGTQDRSGSLGALTPSSQVTLFLGLADPSPTTAFDIRVFAYSFNQDDRTGRGTTDGVTFITDAPGASTHGNALAIGLANAPTVIPPIGGITNDYVRMGDLLGDGSLIADTDDYLYIFEQHFWKGDLLKDYPDQLASFIASLNNYYGV